MNWGGVLMGLCGCPWEVGTAGGLMFAECRQNSFNQSGRVPGTRGQESFGVRLRGIDNAGRLSACEKAQNSHDLQTGSEGHAPAAEVIEANSRIISFESE